MGYENCGRRKSKAVHLLNGNPSRINFAKRREMVATTPLGEPEKPPGLSTAAGRVWDEIAPVLLRMGTLTQADAQTFARLCELESTARYASKQKDEPEFRMFMLTTMVDSAGNEHVNVKVHPAIKLEGETAAKLRPYYDYFGMTPSARARLVAGPVAEEPASKWAGALP